MHSRHYLLADLEDKRRKNKEEGVEIPGWEQPEAPDLSGYDPYDNPGAGKSPGTCGTFTKRGGKSA